MAKSIYPGNQINRLSSYQGQPLIAQPGRAYYSAVGFALVTSTAQTVIPVTIPSPDLRQDDKPRPDITSLVIPAAAKVYHLALRVPDMRKDRAYGTAFSGIVATNDDRVKLASAVNTTAAGALADNDIGTAGTGATALVAASATFAPGTSAFSIITPVAQGAARTLSVYVTNNTGTAAGTGITSTLQGGTPIIVEVSYFLDDPDVADLNDIRLPFISETI